ncbi:hypothetical protein [Aquipseudomonas alcaligenes]|uniref:Uncharacterized protein n=1 Tax=Aquipseudomonas alcaligenes (strain ATCC 14909 / DSM 50342 / CCUG 1425 / JCM 20561 / NBRC 14159 / NCIMB 9945 / NCTC 10367 / 1577) TaxID=1215092 RepID=U3AWJ6_AQUA1|nr:hypothetical protein [Pseudomonas alcaligenes]GAD62024.1 hypothetical protein PA6_009_00270 [Pseudomonas alcaligenes NBRC 14159]SUD16410.1 Uncharacterised protein [Pseudomonas alcaligenes]
MTINDLVDLLQPDFPGCPRATLRDMLRWAQRELCTEGNVWVHNDGLAVVAAQSDAPAIEVPPGAEVLRIFWLKDAGRDLVPGDAFWQPTASTVEFRLPPTSDELDGALVCRPTLGRDMPADLLSRWSEALIHGAKYRLFSMPQPWRDLALSDYHSRQFLSAQADARHLALTGHQQGCVRMQVPRFL